MQWNIQMKKEWAKLLFQTEIWLYIGETCRLDKAISFYTKKIFKPFEVILNIQTVNIYGNIAIVITDCNYTLLLNKKETIHHFAVTEVFVNESNKWSLVQIAFTSLTYSSFFYVQQVHSISMRKFLFDHSKIYKF